jgi:cytochrome c biogenesis protein CcmG/thiol:disulfide interchange protein DsbE
MKQRFLIPLAAFFVLLVFLAIGLTRDPRDVPSPLKDKPAPAFTLPQLAVVDTSFSPADMKGKVWLLNVWSSWCVSCRAEHPLLVAFAKESQLPIVGLSYKEVRGDSDINAGKLSPDDELKLTRQRANAWLAQRGNPYSVVALDMDGRVGIDYGVYGVPETYVIDKAGMIRMKHTGPITPDSLKNQIMPKVAELSK